MMTDSDIVVGWTDRQFVVGSFLLNIKACLWCVFAEFFIKGTSGMTVNGV